MKSYTDLEQSKKLAEILPLESADMCLTFVNNIWNPVWGKADDIYQLQKDCYEPDYTKDEYVDFDEFKPKVVPCWSLAALLEVLPKIINHETLFIETSASLWHIGYRNIYIARADDLLDACVELIIKLKEQNLL